MTLIVGIRCSDGVVVASDSAATYAEGAMPTIGQQNVTKLYQLGDGMLYASTGAIGMQQIIRPALKKLSDDKLHAKAADSADAMLQMAKAIVERVRDMIESARSLVPLVGEQNAGASVLVKSMVAFALKGNACLFTFDFSGAPEEITDVPFVALGSGQRIADPFLALLRRVLWSDRAPTLAEGRLVAAWTVRHVSQTNFGGVGGPIQMASLSFDEKGRPSIAFVDAAEHDANIQDAEAALRQHVLKLGAAPTKDEPTAVPPKAPQG